HGLLAHFVDSWDVSAMLPPLAAYAMLQQRLLVNSPRELVEADALAIFRAAY
ncbi:iron-containing alcohol dehydrogenase, partial [Pseudomonas aeruginosa]